MRELVDRVDLTCHLAVLAQHTKQCTLENPGAPLLKQTKPVPSASASHCTVRAWAKRCLPGKLGPRSMPTCSSAGLAKSSPRTITNRAIFRPSDEVRQQGYALDDQECRPGWRCVGAPIFDQWGTTRVAICLTGTVAELDDAKLIPTACRKRNCPEDLPPHLLEQVEFATY